MFSVRKMDNIKSLNKYRICQATSAHIRTDTRVVVRECSSLAKAGYITTLVIEGDSELLNGINIVGVGEQPKSRIKRMLSFAPKTYNKAKDIQADIFHIHDPEMIPYAIKMKRRGIKIVYDIHEDIPATIIDKEWIPMVLRKPIASMYETYEKKQIRKFDGIIVVTEGIKKKYEKQAKQICVVNNYPDLTDIIHHTTSFESRKRVIGYAGNMGDLYGEKIIYEAMKGVRGNLIIAGGYVTKDTENIKTMGRINREQVNALYGESRLGLVLYQPAGNNNEAQPAKLFEYMAAGLPVVVSNFPLWREIVEENECGLCVEPSDPIQVRDAINYLLDNPSIAQKMGERGYSLAVEKMNWTQEFKKMQQFYDDIMNGN